MKPKPFSGLNHFTVPVAISFPFAQTCALTTPLGDVSSIDVRRTHWSPPRPIPAGLAKPNRPNSTIACIAADHVRSRRHDLLWVVSFPFLAFLAHAADGRIMGWKRLSCERQGPAFSRVIMPVWAGCRNAVMSAVK